LTEKKAEAEAPVEPKTPENNEAVQQQWLNLHYLNN
jgi:hypothetical protein